MIRKVLVAYDTSKQADKAFDFALDLAGRYSAEVIVLSVATLPEPPVMVETEAVLENAREYFEKTFAKLKEKAGACGISPRFEVLVGHPADQIVHLANQEGVDMIVMGHRGKSFMQRWLLGSVSKRVLSYAPCTVSIVR
jgi:nucleotide-binding universal stress UspA family protein